MKKAFNKSFAVDIAFDIIGCMFFSIGVQSLSAPSHLPPGGVTGIAVIVNHLVGLPISLGSLFINVPILTAAWFFLGKQFALKSLKTVIILTATLEICAQFIPPYYGELMLISVFSGVLQGIGLALVFMRGSTTGGIDIVSKLVQLRFPHFPIGKVILAFDGGILVVTAIVYKNIGTAMYALIMVFATSRVIDSIIYGLDRGRLTLVISEHHEKISTAVDQQLGRGSTLLKAVGTYTGVDRPVLMCAVSLEEFHPFKRLVNSIDPNAFVVTMETDEVLGEGFKSLEAGE